MTTSFQETGEWLLGSPLLGVTLTLAAYVAARRLWERTGRHALLNPVLVAIVLVAGVLLLLDIDYASYLEGGRLLLFLLGPATVALALPLHLESGLVRRAALPVLAGVFVGAFVSIAVALLLTDALSGDRQLALSMAPKSATTPVSIALAEQTGGIPALTAVFTILAGVLGAVAGPAVLTLFRFRDVRVRGLAIGASSHGIGTARALEENRREGAFAALAMGLTALATTLVLPLVLALV